MNFIEKKKENKKTNFVRNLCHKRKKKRFQQRKWSLAPIFMIIGEQIFFYFVLNKKLLNDNIEQISDVPNPCQHFKKKKKIKFNKIELPQTDETIKK